MTCCSVTWCLQNPTELTEVCRDSELKELIGSLQMAAYNGDIMMPVTWWWLLCLLIVEGQNVVSTGDCVYICAIMIVFVTLVSFLTIRCPCVSTSPRSRRPAFFISGDFARLVKYSTKTTVIVWCALSFYTHRLLQLSVCWTTGLCARAVATCPSCCCSICRGPSITKPCNGDNDEVTLATSSSAYHL